MDKYCMGTRYIFDILLIFTSTIVATDNNGSYKSQAAKIAGDIILGGLFPVHKKSITSAPCGEIQPDRGIQRLEAMLFTIDEINRKSDLLPDVTLGANILDTCSRDTYALEQSLEYVRGSMTSLSDIENMYVCKDGSKPSTKHGPVAVAGVVGGSYSTVSIQVANLLRLFHIPQISYASTSAELSDKTRFGYFARTVPPDNFQAKAMADMVRHFNWTYVSTVASDGDYGESGIESFKHEARMRNICMAATEKIPPSATAEDFDDIVNELRSKAAARVVVLFLRVEDARNLLLAAKRVNATGFVWIASDGWGTELSPIEGNTPVANGALTLELKSPVLTGFDEYFQNLKPLENKRNPWFEEFWENIHDCIFNVPELLINETTECTGDESLSINQESKIHFVYDAVYAMAHALHNYIEDMCGNVRRRNRRNCIKKMRIDGETLFNKYIINNTFKEADGVTVAFNERGDGAGRYNIRNYRQVEGEELVYDYVTVGEWSDGLTMNTSQSILWAGSSVSTPVSQCSQPCRFDQIMQGDSCCWICTTCDAWQIVLPGGKECQDCPRGWWPTPDKTTCLHLLQQYVSWDSLFAIIPAGLALVGIVLTSMVIYVFMRNIDTPIVKASGRELSFVLLTGFLICFFMTFLLLTKPTVWTCSFHRFGIGFGFAVVYASLLTKTNRISRIFNSARLSAKRPPFISPKSQLVITAFLVIIQVAITCVWFVLEPPGVRLYHPGDNRDQIVLKCNMDDISFLISLTYNMLLILICTIYAVKTRRIPENFNESKFIGFTMYTTCIIWLAFVPIYFGTLNAFQVQITTMCVSTSLSAFVALLCLFTPKMYILVWQPEKNVRKLTMATGNTYKTALTNDCNDSNNHEHMKLKQPLNAGSSGADEESDKDSLNSIAL